MRMRTFSERLTTLDVKLSFEEFSIYIRAPVVLIYFVYVKIAGSV
jgi:hypothetical protein